MAVEFGAGAEDGEDVEGEGQELDHLSSRRYDRLEKTAYKDKSGVESPDSR